MSEPKYMKEFRSAELKVVHCQGINASFTLKLLGEKCEIVTNANMFLCCCQRSNVLFSLAREETQ